MKPRRVIVTLELITDAPMNSLRRVDCWQDASGEPYEWGEGVTHHVVHQVQVNVVKK